MMTGFSKFKFYLTRNAKTLSLALLSGIMAGTSFFPFPPWALIVFWTPLLLGLRPQNFSWKDVFIHAWITSFVLSVIGFHWIYYVSRVFGFFPAPLAALTLWVFATFMHLYIPISFAVAFHCGERWNWSWKLKALAALSLVSLCERFWPSIFPFHLGYPLLQGGPFLHGIAQWADTVGFLGLAFLVYLMSWIFAWWWDEKPRTYRTRLALYCSVAFLALLSWTGTQKVKQYREIPSSPLNILQVQANIGNLERLAAEQGQGDLDSILRRFLNLTQSGVDRAKLEDTRLDLIVWPEGAFPGFLDVAFAENPLPQSLRAAVRKWNVPLLTGSYGIDLRLPQRPVYNSMYLINPDGTQSQGVHKTIRLAFGDYTPWANEIPLLAKLSPVGVGFAKGPGPQVLNFKNLILGAQICYESLYPEFTRDLILKGAHLIVNLTNDSWFGPNSEPEQHLMMTMARAIESRRPVVRSTNTGITSAMTAAGDLLEASPLFKPWAAVFELPVPIGGELTFY